MTEKQHEQRCETCAFAYKKYDGVYSPRLICKLTNWNVDLYNIKTEFIGVVGCASWQKK